MGSLSPIWDGLGIYPWPVHVTNFFTLILFIPTSFLVRFQLLIIFFRHLPTPRYRLPSCYRGSTQDFYLKLTYISFYLKDNLFTRKPILRTPFNRFSYILCYTQKIGIIKISHNMSCNVIFVPMLRSKRVPDSRNAACLSLFVYIVPVYMHGSSFRAIRFDKEVATSGTRGQQHLPTLCRIVCCTMVRNLSLIRCYRYLRRVHQKRRG